MGKIRLVEQYIRKHTKELEISLIEIRPKLIEAFVNIYGEKHREQITYVINSLEYIFFISEEYNYMFSKMHRGISKRNTEIMKTYLRYIKKQNYIFNTVSSENQERFIVERLLPRYPFNIEDYSAFADSIETDCPCCSAAFYTSPNGEHAKFFVCLPIFTIDLKTIIHEINHALNINIIGYTEEVLMMRCLFKREYSEELVNDYIATLVKKEYLRIGGTIPKPLTRINIGNEYEYKDYIVEYLFECLELLLLESRISGNFNLFYELVGKHNAKRLDDLIEELYNKDDFDEEMYTELINLINEIYEKVINTKPINPDEYLDELESSGVKLRRLKKAGE